MAAVAAAGTAATVAGAAAAAEGAGEAAEGAPRISEGLGTAWVAAVAPVGFVAGAAALEGKCRPGTSIAGATGGMVWAATEGWKSVKAAVMPSVALAQASGPAAAAAASSMAVRARAGGQWAVALCDAKLQKAHMRCQGPLHAAARAASGLPG